ncbi:MAG: hypothetical protein R3283_10300, partial [Balneolaceae bacterium]|nr:hypothetical protein [Balneolaceae bacterium]
MKYSSPLILILLLLQFSGCSGDSLNSSQTVISAFEPSELQAKSESKTQSSEERTELYFMYGIQISKRL